MMLGNRVRAGLGALFVLASALVPGAPLASAQGGSSEETIRYTIQVGDTCYGIAQRFFGNPRQCHEVIYRYNPHMGTDASNIRPGVTITIPVRNQDAPDARVTRTAREVQARSSSSADWRSARRGLGLYRGWHVSTEEAASAEVTFRDESQIQMRENTLVIIYGGSADNTARRRTSQATLERGTLRSRLGDLRLQVDTPSGETELNGGSSVVTVDGEGSSVVSNHSGGSARVRGASGAPVTVRPGFGSTVVRGERPARPRPLPATPQLTADTSRSVIGVVGTGGTLVGEWAEVPNAAYYRVELSSEADGSGLIAAVQAPASIRRFEVHRLPAGTYYLALATIDGTRLESRPSERVPLTVALVGLQAPGAPEADLTSVAEGDWGRAASPPAVLRGTRFFSPAGFTCGLGDAPAAAEGVFTRPGVADVTCTPASGGPLPAVGVQVEQPAVTVAGLEPGAPASLLRGSSQEITFTLDASQPLPELRVIAPEGVTIEEVEQDEGRLVVTLVASPSAPANFELVVVAVDPEPVATEPTEATEPGETPEPTEPEPTEPAPTEPTELEPVAPRPQAPIAELRVDVQEPEAAPEPVPDAAAAEPEAVAFVEPPTHLQEAFGLTGHPSLMGLVNDRRVGSGGFTMLSHQGRLGQNEGYWRASVGIEASPTSRLRLGVAHAVDVAENGVVPAERGDRDLQAWAGYRLLTRDDVSLYAELGAWFPTGGEREGIERVRLGPSLSLSVRVGERFFLRTRQGALLGMASAGPFLWASAYGVDVELVEQLYVGLEVDSSIGRAGGDLFAGLGAGLGLSALFGPAAIQLGFRYGLTNDFQDAVGRFTLTAGVRLALE